MPGRPAPPRALTVAVAAAALALSAGLSAPARATGVLPVWVVTYDAPPAEPQLEALRAVGGSVQGFTRLPAAVVAAPAWLVPLLRNLPGVRGVWANERYSLLDMGSNRTIRADQAWGPYAGGLGWTGTGATGRGVGIGVIDAGVDGTHPDLCMRPEFCRLGTPVKTVQNVKFVGDTDRAEPYVAIEDVVNTDNSSGHGSHVAGIAAGYGTASAEPGRYQGVAPGADLVGLGVGEAIEVVNVLAAFEYALANRDRYNIRVLNNSWGPGAGTPYDPDHPVNRAIDAAWDAGVSVVFGAGNDGPRTDSLNMFSVNPHAISVAATRKDGHLAFFSSRGVPGSPLWHPTVAAPGENIVSVRSLSGATTHAGDATSANPEPIPAEDTPYYGNVNGTSMASPHVAGVVALMQDAAHTTAGRWLTPAEVRAIIQRTARTDSVAGLPNYQGYSMGAGLVDAAAAVAAARALAQTAPYGGGVSYDVRPFGGSVGAAAFVQTSVFESSVPVAAGAVSLDVMVDWKAQPNDVDITVYDPSGANRGSTQLRCDPNGQPNGYSSFCSSAPNERLSFPSPAPGTWRVVVGAFANTAESVRGLWSVAYPSGSAPAVPGPVSVALAAAAPVGVQGQGVGLTATVRDAAGQAVPNAVVTWTSTGAGSVRQAETLTGADGVAVATALSDVPGSQQITAAVGAASAATGVTWLGVVVPTVPSPGTPADSPGRASGGGWFRADGGGKRHLAVYAELVRGATAPGGTVTYDDRAGVAVTADVVERFRVSGNQAVFSGPASLNGASGYRYEVTVVDNGDADTFRIVLTRPAAPLWSYTASGPLGGGNLKVMPAG